MKADKRIFAPVNQKAGMNKDEDIRYIPNGQYLDARNIQIMDNGNRFTVVNAKGNSLKDSPTNSGSTLCIGSFDDKVNQTIYEFIWNGNGDHEILKYPYAIYEGLADQIVEGSGLGFEFNKMITGIVIVNDRFLVWAQEGQEIGCIDLDNYASLPTITASNRWRIELAKAVDLAPLIPYYGTEESRPSNTLKNKQFKFRYRYVYAAGFRTICSPISNIAVPEFSMISSSTIQYDNVIWFELDLPSFDEVEKVELLVQSGTSDETMGDWYKFKEVTYADIDSNRDDVVTIAFTGNERLEAVDQTEVNQPQGFVPKYCKDVVFLPSNVLAMLNITEGYDIDITPSMHFVPTYNARPTAASATTTVTYVSTPVAITSEEFRNVNYDIYLDDDTSALNYVRFTVGGTPKQGDVITISMTLAYGGSAPVSTPNKTIEIRYNVKTGDTTSTIASKLANLINAVDTRSNQFGGIVAYANSAQCRIVYGSNVFQTTYLVSTSVSAATPTVTNSTVATETDPKIGLKRYSGYPYAIQYNFPKNRRSTAIKAGDIYIQGYADTSNDSFVSGQIIIDQLPPDDAISYDILIGKNATMSAWQDAWCLVYRVTEVEYDGGSGAIPDVGDTINDTTSGAQGILLKRERGDAYTGTFWIGLTSGTISNNDVLSYDGGTWTGAAVGNGTALDISAVNFPERVRSYIQTYGYKGMEWNYVDGDRARFIAEVSGGNKAFLSSDVDTEINSTTSDYYFVNIDVTASPISASNGDTLLVEVWRPLPDSEDKIYWEIAKQYEISGGYHLGDVQNQTASQSAVISLDNVGDCYDVGFNAFPFSGDEDNIESMSVSPFVRLTATSIGRANIEDPNGLKEINRESAISYTQPIIKNSPTNGLSVVLESSIYDEFGTQYGSIQKAFLRQDRNLLIFFEDKVGYMGVFSELRKAANGDVSYRTDSLANQITFYAYDGGIGLNPESFAYYNTTAYFICARNNAACRLGAAGSDVDEISDYGMSQWFNENLDSKVNLIAPVTCPAVYDERNGSYIVTFYRWIEASSIGTGSGGGIKFNYTNISDAGAVASSTKSYAVITDGSNYYLKSSPTYQAASPASPDAVEIVYAGNPTPAAATTAWIKVETETLQFNENVNAWVCFLDFKPDIMSTMGVDYCSYQEGSLYQHNDPDADRCDFYGTAYEAELTIPFNLDPSEMKVFMNIEQECNNPWASETDGDVYTPAGQTSQILEAWYKQKQPEQYSSWIGRDTTTPAAICPNDPLYEGLKLRDTSLLIRMTNDSTTEAKLRSVTLISESSNLSS